MSACAKCGPERSPSCTQPGCTLPNRGREPAGSLAKDASKEKARKSERVSRVPERTERLQGPTPLLGVSGNLEPGHARGSRGRSFHIS